MGKVNSTTRGQADCMLLQCAGGLSSAGLSQSDTALGMHTILLPVVHCWGLRPGLGMPLGLVAARQEIMRVVSVCMGVCVCVCVKRWL